MCIFTGGLEVGEAREIREAAGVSWGVSRKLGHRVLPLELELELGHATRIRTAFHLGSERNPALDVGHLLFHIFDNRFILPGPFAACCHIFGPIAIMSTSRVRVRKRSRRNICVMKLESKGTVRVRYERPWLFVPRRRNGYMEFGFVILENYQRIPVVLLYLKCLLGEPSPTCQLLGRPYPTIW